MSLPEILKTALDKIQYIAKTETIFGDPIEIGNIILIPVSKVSIGFAAGGSGTEKKIGAGSGTGGGVQITPVAFISVCGDKVKIHSLEKFDDGLGKILSMTPEVIKKVSEFMGKKSKKGKESGKGKKEKPGDDKSK